MMKYILFLFAITMTTTLAAQDLPYRELANGYKDYEEGNVLARMVDGFGFRYYWATDGLKAKDLKYRPTEDARSTSETLQHVYGLSETILNAVQSVPTIRPVDWTEMTLKELRKGTLENLKKASEIIQGLKQEDLEKAQMIFQRGGKEFTFPMWNLINGPIADGIYHAGQIVSFRRSSGNPVNPKVNVLLGKLND